MTINELLTILEEAGEVLGYDAPVVLIATDDKHDNDVLLDFNDGFIDESVDGDYVVLSTNLEPRVFIPDERDMIKS